MDNTKIPFVAFVLNHEMSEYWVFLVNPTPKSYARVVTLTGAYMGMGDDLLETGKAVKDCGELSAMSTMTIESGELDELEFRIWYHLDLYEAGAKKPKHFWFELPGVYGALNGYKPEDLPLISKGQVLELSPCAEESIDEEVKKLVMKPQYHKHG